MYSLFCVLFNLTTVDMIYTVFLQTGSTLNVNEPCFMWKSAEIDVNVRLLCFSV